MIPTIQVNARENPTKDFESFKKMITESTKTIGYAFQNFTFIDEPQEKEINGEKAIYFKTKYNMTINNGERITVRSWTYAIPKGNFFYQVNFSDEMDKDDCSKIYEEVIQTIKL